MEEVDLNLAGLSDEELLHIQEVLSRDKKLQENKQLIRPTVNNNTEIRGKPIPTATDLVMAEIDRVHRLTPISDMSGRSTPVRSEAESNDEGFFASFADMISRGMEAIDFTGSNKKGKRSTLASFARGVMNRGENNPKTPFRYNPRETVKKKPTLLELAATRRRSSPATNRIEQIDQNGISSKNRERKNAIFSSLPTTSSTLPRKSNLGSTGFLAGLGSPKPRHKPMRSISSPTERKKFSLVSPAKTPTHGLKSPQTTRTKTLETNTERAKTPSTKGTPATTPSKQKSEGLAESGKSKTLPPGKRMTKQRSLDSQGSTQSAEKRSVGLASPVKNSSLPRSSKITVSSHSSPEKECIIPEIMESPVTPVTHTQSNDSGVYPKTEFFMRKDDNDSSLEDETEKGHLEIYDYEPDTESVYDVDTRRYTDGTDDLSLYSVSSSFYGSPMRRPTQIDVVQDSWDDSDASSGIFANQLQASFENARLIKHVSPSAHQPRWVKPKGNKRTKQHHRYSGAEFAMTQSPGSSPSLSHRSVPNSVPSSPLSARFDAIQGSVESSDTIGNMEISLVYYAAELFNRKKRTRTEIPAYGTKSVVDKSCNVLCRKEYVEVTNSDLVISDRTKSGAPESSDGELHVIIKGAKFQDSSGKIKSPNTYVKCYLLPDKFHNSKMKSAIIKKNKEPKWDHKFILVGFSQSELRERSLEIIVGSWHFKKQEVLGGAILSVGQGDQSHPWINSTKAEAYVWKTALQISGNKVKTLLPLRAHMKPTYL